MSVVDLSVNVSTAVDHHRLLPVPHQKGVRQDLARVSVSAPQRREAADAEICVCLAGLGVLIDARIVEVEAWQL
jgi:hypothetical protein